MNHFQAKYRASFSYTKVLELAIFHKHFLKRTIWGGVDNLWKIIVDVTFYQREKSGQNFLQDFFQQVWVTQMDPTG